MIGIGNAPPIVGDTILGELSSESVLDGNRALFSSIISLDCSPFRAGVVSPFS